VPSLPFPSFGGYFPSFGFSDSWTVTGERRRQRLGEVPWERFPGRGRSQIWLVIANSTSGAASC
jgi:hypothetical protein